MVLFVCHGMVKNILLSSLTTSHSIGTLYLLQEKSQSVNIFKAFINEVEKQLDEKVKIVRLAKAVTTMKNLMKIVKI